VVRDAAATSVRGPHRQLQGLRAPSPAVLVDVAFRSPPSSAFSTSSAVLLVRPHSRRARLLVLARSSSLQCLLPLFCLLLLLLARSSLKLSPFAALGDSAPASPPPSRLLLNPLGSSSVVSFCFDIIRQPGGLASTAGSGRRRWAGARVFCSRWPRLRAPSRGAVCADAVVRCDAGQQLATVPVRLLAAGARARKAEQVNALFLRAPVSRTSAASHCVFLRFFWDFFRLCQAIFWLSFYLLLRGKCVCGIKIADLNCRSSCALDFVACNLVLRCGIVRFQRRFPDPLSPTRLIGRICVFCFCSGRPFSLLGFKPKADSFACFSTFLCLMDRDGT
jgi:hypothetical protein